MEPRFQTSFIPKKPIVATQGSSSAPVIRTTNIVTLIANVMFVVALVVSGGLFFYKQLLQKQIATVGQSIDDARGAFQIEKIQELIDADARLNAITNLLNNHVSVSKLLTFLSEVTVKKVKINELIYKSEAGATTVTMKVEAASYNALAAQGEVFSKNEFIKTPFFTNYSTADNGFIRADFSSKIDTTLTSYKKSIEGDDTTPSIEPVVPTVPPVPSGS